MARWGCELRGELSAYHQITKFKGFGIEFEKDVRQLRENVKSVETAAGDLEKGVGPGSKTAVTALSIPPFVTSTATGAPPIYPEDPNKGQFGGQSEANGRRLTATIQPHAKSKSSRCQVNIKVVSTDPARPLTGKVKLYLHPTFGRWSSYEIEVKSGVAEDQIVSYGAFTIGAEADKGKTRLELDLMDVSGGTERFYEL